MDIEKSLVYFSSSLKGNELTIEKIMRGRVVKLYEEDQDLLEDVLIEVKQAVDMSGIYLDILSSTMESFASLISNNLNMVMKVLASITLIISIPMVISGYYGMNVEGIPLYHLLVSDCCIHTLHGGGGCHSQKETNALRLRVPVHTCLLQPAFRENAGFFLPYPVFCRRGNQ